jgi:hypothetical protein
VSGRARAAASVAAGVALFLLMPARAVATATFVIHNNDSAGVGFNDTTAAAPVGGNTGTTIGQQRLIAFTYAASLWGNRLTSAVPIVIGATFGPLSCSTNSGVLGSAGPAGILSFPTVHGVVPANTWVSEALGEKLAGSDQNSGGEDITASFNGNVGKTGCLVSESWYLGLDGGATGSQLDFVSVLLHELGHGLGFLTFVDKSTGALDGGLPDMYELNLYDDTTSKAWSAMTNAERQASVINTNHVVWTGANVTAASGPLTSGKDGSGHVLVYTPNPLQGGSSISHWTQEDSTFCASCTDLLPLDLMKPVYKSPVHTTFLTHLALQDMGWGVVKSGVVARGDANADGSRDVSDVFFLINYLFAGGPFPLGLGDADKNGAINIADVFYLINFLFAGGPPPPA